MLPMPFENEPGEITVAPELRERSSKRSSRWVYALAASSLVHAGTVYAATVYGLPWLLLPRIAPVESGLESLALRASTGSLGESDEGRVSPVEVTTPIEWTKAEEPTAVRLAPEPTIAARSARSLSEAERANQPAADVIGEVLMDLPLTQATPAKRSLEAQPTVELDELPALPRAVLASEMKVEFNDAAIRSDASSGSEANQGADVDVRPVVVFNPRPPYPPALLQKGIAGVVKLAVTVGVDGTVVAADIYETSGVPEFDKSSLETVRQWRFRPAMRRGEPVQWTVAVPIHFVIENRATGNGRRTR
jgi:TonB family protein